MNDAELAALGVKVTRLDRGVRVDLPRRDLGAWRLAGGVVVLFSLAFVAAPVAGAAVAIGHGGPAGWVGTGIAALLLLGVAPPLWLGLTVLAGHGRVAVDDRRVVVSEGVGPFRKRWKRKVDAIEGVVVGVPAGGLSQKLPRVAEIDPATLTTMAIPGMRGPRSCITFIVHDGKNPLPAALGYPAETVLAVAEVVVDALRGEQRVALFDGVDGRVPLLAPPAGAVSRVRDVVEAETSFSSFEDARIGETPESLARDAAIDAAAIPEQPATSRVVLDVRDDGLTLTVPPVGVWKGSKGGMTFSIIWLGFIAVFGAFMAFLGAPAGFAVPAGLVLALFLAIGVAMLVGAVNAGRRRAILDVVGTRLVVTRKSLFGLKQDEFDAADLRSIRIGKTGTEINDAPIRELQVRPRRGKGKKLGLLSQLPDEEIQWIAAVLRVALGVGR